jgi:hypothetical protein
MRNRVSWWAEEVRPISNGGLVAVLIVVLGVGIWIGYSLSHPYAPWEGKTIIGSKCVYPDGHSGECPLRRNQ